MDHSTDQHALRGHTIGTSMGKIKYVGVIMTLMSDLPMNESHRRLRFWGPGIWYYLWCCPTFMWISDTSGHKTANLHSLTSSGPRALRGLQTNQGPMWARPWSTRWGEWPAPCQCSHACVDRHWYHAWSHFPPFDSERTRNAASSRSLLAHLRKAPTRRAKTTWLTSLLQTWRIPRRSMTASASALHSLPVVLWERRR